MGKKMVRRVLGSAVRNPVVMGVVETRLFNLFHSHGPVYSSICILTAALVWSSVLDRKSVSSLSTRLDYDFFPAAAILDVRNYLCIQWDKMRV